MPEHHDEGEPPAEAESQNIYTKNMLHDNHNDIII